MSNIYTSIYLYECYTYYDGYKIDTSKTAAEFKHLVHHILRTDLDMYDIKISKEDLRYFKAMCLAHGGGTVFIRNENGNYE